MIFQFQTPAMFALALLIPLVVYFDLKKRPRPALRFPTTTPVPLSWRHRLVRLPLALRCVALALLTVALARPISGRNPIRNVTEGIAIEMIMDRSGSMSTGMRYRGKSLERFDVAKSVFYDFVMGDGGDLPGRPNDLIGVIAFAGYPDTISPLTNSREALSGVLKELHVIRDPAKDGTAIGDAIALGAARLKTAEEVTESPSKTTVGYKIKSKIMILLTDGENNAGKRVPAQAAALARQWGIKVYTIGVASGPEETFLQSSADLLSQIAETTGGMFRVATDGQTLHAVYKEIDRLEKSEVETMQYLDIREYFLPFALAALVLLLAELGLSLTVLRRLP